MKRMTDVLTLPHLVILTLLLVFTLVLTGCPPQGTRSSSTPQGAVQSPATPAATPTAAASGQPSSGQQGRIVGLPPKAPIQELIVAGSIIFERDVKPKDVRELGEKENKRKFYSYHDGSVDVTIEAIKYTHSENLLWVDEQGMMSFLLKFEKPVTLPLNGTITIKRNGYEAVVLKDLKISTNPLVLPDIKMKRKG